MAIAPVRRSRLAYHTQRPRRPVGANGTGKSTLLKILDGMENVDYGSINVAKGTSSGYLPQDGLNLAGRTVFAECMSVFDALRALEHEMED